LFWLEFFETRLLLCWSPTSSCLNLPSPGIKNVCHHAGKWVFLNHHLQFFYKLRTNKHKTLTNYL
jgi:hypothetical protein